VAQGPGTGDCPAGRTEFGGGFPLRLLRGILVFVCAVALLGFVVVVLGCRPGLSVS